MYIGFIRWDVKQMKDFSDCIPFYEEDDERGEMISGANHPVKVLLSEKCFFLQTHKRH